MSGLVVLIPIAVVMGVGALATFLWALKSGQYEDMDGAGARILDEDSGERPPARERTRSGIT